MSTNILPPNCGRLALYRCCADVGQIEDSTEALAEVNCQIAETALALAVDFKVSENAVPFLILLTAFLLEVGKKVHAQLLLIKKIELLVKQLLEATAADSFRLFKH